MTDATWRRRVRAGADERRDDLDAVRRLRARWRSGELALDRLALASFLGSESARVALGSERAPRVIVCPRDGKVELRRVLDVPAVAGSVSILGEEVRIDHESEPASIHVKDGPAWSAYVLSPGDVLETGDDPAAETFVFAGTRFDEAALAWSRVLSLRGMVFSEDCIALLDALGSPEAVAVALVIFVRARLSRIDRSLRRLTREAVDEADAWLLDRSDAHVARFMMIAQRTLRVSDDASADPLLGFVDFFGLLASGRRVRGERTLSELAAEVVVALMDSPVGFARCVREPLLRWALAADVSWPAVA